MKTEATDERIRIETTLPVPMRLVWALLTKKAHIANWWGDHVSLQAKLGGEFLERWSDGGRQVVTSGKVTRWEPPVEMEMTWADHDWPDDTLVAFRLSERGRGTRLVLEHSGWRVHPKATRRGIIEAHASGWSQHLASLAEYAAGMGP